MSTEDDFPKIRKAIFKLGGDRIYSFDVNQNITIYNLKKMIIAAADLGKNLRIFHDGEEYTDKNDDALDFLFPTLEVVVFEVSPTYQNIEEFDELIKLKMSTQYCPEHHSKYPYYYCRSCDKSICSRCIKGDHQNHNYMEKYDYLQSSKIMADKLFKNLIDNMDDIDKDSILELEDKIKIKYFPSLVEMVKKIEAKLIYVIEEFLKKEKGNLQKVKGDMATLTKNVADGLDILKDRVSIEDMMVDEKIFLTFDKKFRSISSEKDKISSSIKSYNQFKQQLKLVTDSTEKIYNEIYSFLEKYLTMDIYANIIRDIDGLEIIPFSKKDVFKVILSDIKNNEKKYIKKLKKGSKYSSDNEDYNITRTKPKTHFVESNTSKDFILKNEGKDLMTKFANYPEKKESPAEGGIVSFYDTKYLCQPIAEKNMILIYDTSSKSINNVVLDGSNIFIKKIPEDCAWINHNNCLYISGGEINQKISSSFIKYDPVQNKFDLLSPVPDNKEYHSMCVDENNNLYVVGGLNNTVYKYSISKNKWTAFEKKLICQRSHPICLVLNNELYVFFGSNIYGGYVNSFEKTNINGKNNFVLYNVENINLEYASTIEKENGEILFFGGRNETGILKSSFKFNPSTNTVEKSKYELTAPSLFHQSTLPQIGDNCFGNFSLEKDYTFVKLNINQ